MIDKLKMTGVAMFCTLAVQSIAKNLFVSGSLADMPSVSTTLIEPEEVPIGHLKNDITYNQAAFLVQNLLGNNSFFNIAKNYGFSGFLSKQTLNRIIPRNDADPSTTGLLVYLCYDKGNESDSKDDQVFLAYKHGTGFTENMDVPLINSNDVYYKTKFKISYEGQENPSIDQVKTELTKAIAVDSTENDTIMGSSVLAFSNEFKSAFRSVDDVSSEDIECNKYSFGFIPLYELDLLRFSDGVNQNDFMGIRFYLGFDNTEYDNRIRVFFVGALADKNIIMPENTTNPRAKYGRFIERSRP